MRNVARAAPEGYTQWHAVHLGAKTAADSRPARAPNQRARLAYTPGKQYP
ncbi:hypothetical protein NEUTE2DRAFT_169702 [Neurospora tetrasperma FGSC 2509]|nr:hypothetical protein NEUTE2DRAFT_169702 [Neurospora tetrasperma FGSC 2509]